jgi:hypothetical protein
VTAEACLLADAQCDMSDFSEVKRFLLKWQSVIAVCPITRLAQAPNAAIGGTSFGRLLSIQAVATVPQTKSAMHVGPHAIRGRNQESGTAKDRPANP